MSFKFILDGCVREGTQKEKQKPSLEELGSLQIDIFEESIYSSFE